jgi:hypothetical protein
VEKLRERISVSKQARQKFDLETLDLKKPMRSRLRKSTG